MQIRSASHFDFAIFSVTSRVDLYRPEMSVLPSRPFENSGKYIHLSSNIPIWESVVSSSFVAIQTKHGMYMSPRDLNLRRQWICSSQAGRFCRAVKTFSNLWRSFYIGLLRGRLYARNGFIKVDGFNSKCCIDNLTSNTTAARLVRSACKANNGK